MTTILYRFGHDIDLVRLHAWLSDTYWAKGRSLEVVTRAVRGSFCISAWTDAEMVGFARVVTDFCVTAYVCDVIVDPAWRRQGIGHGMVDRLLRHEALATCACHLHTRDAHPVYRRLGFNDFPSMLKRRRRALSPDEATAR